MSVGPVCRRNRRPVLRPDKCACGPETTFDGIIDGGTGTFAATHGTFHAQAQPNGEHLTITLGSGG